MSNVIDLNLEKEKRKHTIDDSNWFPVTDTFHQEHNWTDYAIERLLKDVLAQDPK
jgi:hypothetical protein